MQAPKKVRVAAVQFATGTDVSENLATCLRMLDAAARERPALVVLPEFSNHLSWYDDAAHCARVAVDLGGPFLEAIAAKAKAHALHVVVNCTIRRSDGDALAPDPAPERGVTATSLLFGPSGALLGASDKQVLMGHENDFLVRAAQPGPVIETAIGRIGLYACMDGVVCETARSLALRGAQILCNSLNSFAPDEAELHVPVRAAENRVFVVAANKVGPLIPAALVDAVSATTRIPARFLSGAGESQIVAPDGAVLAKAPPSGEAVVVAEIAVEDADAKRRPDGTDVFRSRRPDLYRAIAERPASPSFGPADEELRVAAVQPRAHGAEAIAEVTATVSAAVTAGARLVVLPELFFAAGARVDDARAAADLSEKAVAAIAAALASQDEAGASYVAASLVEEDGGELRHVGVLIGAEGIALRQPQLHACARHAGWANARPAEQIATLDLPFGRVALVVGDDALYPETMRLVAMRGVEIALVPFHALEPWETALGLPERAAENRVCVVGATRPTAAGTSLIATLWQDFTIMTPWSTRPFDGRITAPRLTRAAPEPGVLAGAIHPVCAHNKVVSHRTHLLDDRAWSLAGAIAKRA